MDLEKLIMTRRTYRRFNQEKEIPIEVVKKIEESIRYASCAGNKQELKYIFIRDRKVVEKIFPHTHWAAYLPKEEGTPKEGEHPSMYVAILKKKNDKSNFIYTDMGLAISNMTISAWKEEVGSCIMANIEKEELESILEIEDEYEISYMVAFGYPIHDVYIEDIDKDQSIKYYLDENGDYVVPKKLCKDIIKEI